MSFVPLPVGFDPLVNDWLREAAEAASDRPTVSTTTVTAAVPSARALEHDGDHQQFSHTATGASEAHADDSDAANDAANDALRRELEADREARERLQPRPAFSFDLASQEAMTETSSLPDDDDFPMSPREPLRSADIPALHEMAASWAEVTADAVAEAARQACGEQLEQLDTQGLSATDEGTEEAVTTVEAPGHEAELKNLIGEAADLPPALSSAVPAPRLSAADAETVLAGRTPSDAEPSPPQSPRRVISLKRAPRSPAREPHAEHRGSPLRRRGSLGKASGSPDTARSATRVPSGGKTASTEAQQLDLHPTSTLGEVCAAHAAEAKSHADTAATMAAMAVDIAMHDGLLLGSAQTVDQALHAAGLENTGLPFEPMDTITEQPAPGDTPRPSIPISVVDDVDDMVVEQTAEEEAATTSAALRARDALQQLRARGWGGRRHRQSSGGQSGGGGGGGGSSSAGSDTSHSEGSDKGLGPRRPYRIRNISTRSAVSARSQSSTGSLQTTHFSTLASHPSEGFSGQDLVPIGANVPDALEDAIVGASVVDQAPTVIYEGIAPPRTDTESSAADEHAITHVTTTGATVSTPLARTVIVTTTTTTQAEVMPEESTTDPDEELEGHDQAAITTTTTTIVTYPKPQPSKKRPLLVTLMVALLPLAVGCVFGEGEGGRGAGERRQGEKRRKREAKHRGLFKHTRHQCSDSAASSVASRFTLGFTSPIDLTEPTVLGGAGLSESDASFFGASVNLGAAGGALIGIPLLSMLGRRGCVAGDALDFYAFHLPLYFPTPLLTRRLLPPHIDR